MAKVNGSNWRLYRDALKLTSNKAGDLLDISGGHLRQIEANKKPASDELVLRAARLYRCEMVDLLRATEDPATEPPSRKQEKEGNTAPGRDGGGGTSPGKSGEKSGPKRVRGQAA